MWRSHDDDERHVADRGRLLPARVRRRRGVRRSAGHDTPVRRRPASRRRGLRVRTLLRGPALHSGRAPRPHGEDVRHHPPSVPPRAARDGHRGAARERRPGLHGHAHRPHARRAAYRDPGALPRLASGTSRSGRRHAAAPAARRQVPLVRGQHAGQAPRRGARVRGGAAHDTRGQRDGGPAGGVLLGHSTGRPVHAAARRRHPRLDHPQDRDETSRRVRAHVQD